MGLDVYLVRGPHNDDEDSDCGEHVEIPSRLYPDHLFKIGYARSSYNDGGINSLFRQYGLPDLYAIFEASDEYALTPDWPAVIARTDQALDAFDAAAGRMKYRAMRELLFPEHGVPDAAGALDAFAAQMAKGSTMSGAWSTGSGFYSREPIKTRAVVAGQRGEVFVVYEQKPETLAWYRHSLEIVKESAQWVLAQPDPKDFHLHWSA